MKIRPNTRSNGMKKTSALFFVFISILQVKCSSDKPLPKQVEKSEDLKVDASIVECRDILNDEEDRKAAAHIAESFDIQPVCEELIPRLSDAEDLRLMDRKIRKIRILKYARSLKLLYLGFNEISDLSPLKEHPTLFLLDLQSNALKDVNNLGSMPNLEILSINDNEVAAFIEKHNFPKLTIFLARRNRITNVVPLVKSMPLLGELELTENPLGTSIVRSEDNCPTGALIPAGISDFCKTMSQNLAISNSQ